MRRKSVRSGGSGARYYVQKLLRMSFADDHDKSSQIRARLFVQFLYV